METEPQKSAPILDLAWKRYRTLSDHSSRRNSDFFTIRRRIAYLGVLATLFAILTQIRVFEQLTARYEILAQFEQSIARYEILPFIALIAKLIFIATPILASTLAAFASKKYANGDWWITRAAAEQLKKEIFYYRTIWPKDKRGTMLEDSMENILRQVYRGLGGMFTFEEDRKKKDKKPAPPATEQTGEIDRDPKFTDLNADEYFKYRVEDQIKWHDDKMKKFKADQDRLTVLILLTGALGTVLATLGGNWGILVALTASITTAFIGWEQLRNIEGVLRNYSKVVLELNILKDHWINVEPAKLKPEEYEKEFKLLVDGCETVLWAQNTEYIKAMQDVLKDNNLDQQAKPVISAVEETVVVAKRTTQAMQDHALDLLTGTVNDTGQQLEATFQDTAETLGEQTSQFVQKQLDDASQALSEATENLIERTPTLSTLISKISQDNSHIEVGRDTSKEELNRILASYPQTGEVKG